ncbi:MAG: SCO family protein [Flavobacteriia bacterium]|jgi:cytochrome oxidase Cu insertion factor (SCO1/SenC/PrrC family)
MASKNTAGRMKVLFAFLLLFGPALLLVFFATRGCEHKFKNLDDYGAAANYSFIDARGKAFTSKDFEGDIVVVTTLQETCPDSCAISLWHIDQSIYQHIRKNKRKKMKQVKLISFATDGKGQPVKDLTIFKQALEDQVEGYDPDLWLIATGDVREIYDFKHNGASLLQQGNQYYGGQGFQELLLLLDKKNHLRMVLSGKTEGMVRRMKEHIALLQKQYDKAASEKKKAK